MDVEEEFLEKFPFFLISMRLSTTSLTESRWLIIIRKSNWDFRNVNSMNNELRFSESRFPNPSSIAKKFGLGKFDILKVLVATLADKDELKLDMFTIFVATLADSDELNDVKAPDIFVAIWAEDEIIPLPEIKPCHEPEIPVALGAVL